MKNICSYLRPWVIAALGLACISPVAHAATAAATCPPLGWKESLATLFPADAQMTTKTTPVGAANCAFHMWSWEGFVWATALDPQGVPRFLRFPTTDDLLSKDKTAGQMRTRPLRLAARSLKAHGTSGFTEGAGAFVEADGNVMISRNGYPVYSSVHMNDSYFATAKQNLVIDGGYSAPDTSRNFSVGAAIFKATWLRLDENEAAPEGAYVTDAQVPVLEAKTSLTDITVQPEPGKFKPTRVALVGLHVVGYTENHAEFLWATFEHRQNTPALADGTFKTDGSDPKNYTFYRANTSFTKVNIASKLPRLSFDAKTQRFSPITDAVLLNRTGGETAPDGPANIAAVNDAAQTFLRNRQDGQSLFANYNLIGTVWMPENTYNVSSRATDAVGSTSLANTTAETFLQVAPGATRKVNCFSCHNPTAYSFNQQNPLVDRMIAHSHVLGVGTSYAVPNSIIGKIGFVPDTGNQE